MNEDEQTNDPNQTQLTDCEVCGKTFVGLAKLCSWVCAEKAVKGKTK